MLEADSTTESRLVAMVVAGLRRLAELPRPARRATAAALDACLCVVSIWVSFSLRLGEWDLLSRPAAITAAVALPSWFACAWWFGTYQTIIRSTGNRTMIDLALACGLLAVPMAVVFLFLGVPHVPRTVALLQPMIFLLLLAISRLGIRFIVSDVLGSDRGRRHRVMIYGAGQAGQQLGQALRHERQVTLVGYVDDDPRLVGQRLEGVRIHSAAAVRDIVEEHEVNEVLVALPSISRSRRAEIIEHLQAGGVHVRSLPSIGHIIDGKVSVSDLRNVQIEELLGRDAVPPDENLLAKTITGSVVLVTGAGGSIGSELCRQIVARHPKRLILVDHSEFALYLIDAELRKLDRAEIDIVAELGDIADEGTARRLLNRWRPDTVFHAAAYKHVPLVEVNPVAGLRNNVLGTLHCCRAAEEADVRRFVLVSTDKAVRPTNIMGSSKRICELILQARAVETSGTIFAMVRFGNVLGSSGSVVPKFREQIARGGPVTITHSEVTRYFMTIPEAAQLVLQAGAMAAGGEVFVLDMRDPIKIIDLARSMIQLSGLTVRDTNNPDGDIAIVEVGLRPGEKMYEELLIGDDPRPTAHASILQAREKMIPWPALVNELNRLQRMLDDGDAAGARTSMQRLVPEYRPGETAAAPCSDLRPPPLTESTNEDAQMLHFVARGGF